MAAVPPGGDGALMNMVCGLVMARLAACPEHCCVLVQPRRARRGRRYQGLRSGPNSAWMRVWR